MTGREAISAQDNGFFGVAGLVGVDCFGVAVGVAGGVIGSELSKVGFDWSIGDVSIKVGSLDVGVGAGGVGIVATVVVILAGSAFGVEGGVGIAGSLGVVSAGSFGEGIVISLAGFSGFFWW